MDLLSDSLYDIHNIWDSFVNLTEASVSHQGTDIIWMKEDGHMRATFVEDETDPDLIDNFRDQTEKINEISNDMTNFLSQATSSLELIQRDLINNELQLANSLKNITTMPYL